MHSFYLPPGKLDLIAVTGPDAIRLLQGQVTCDVGAVPDPGFTRGALCNNKGRVLATFILVHCDATLYLVMSEGLGAVLTQTLKKYLPFYKCELRAADGAVIGIAGDHAVATITGTAPPASGTSARTESGWICCLDSARQLYIAYGRELPPIPAELVAGSDADWFVAGLPSGLFPFTAGDVEKYTPQDLHLDRNGYVSFTKGCYTGQEIVARLHYRGKLKKLLFLLQADSALSPPEPVEILDGANQVIGASLRVFHVRGRLYVLAQLPADLEHKPPGSLENRDGVQFNLRIF